MMDNTTPIWESPFINRSGQQPMTRFIPMADSVKVDITEVHVPKDLTEFVGACHRGTLDEANDLASDQNEVLASIGRGKTLWQCGEVVSFGLRISGVSRVFTHQLVRARVGVSFSQQCTGDIDCRHMDVCVPQSLYHADHEQYLNAFISNALNSKVLYALLVDSGDISIQEARYILPAGVSGHIHLRICLGALAELYKKRSCTMTQTWEMIVFAQKLKREITLHAPWALPMFKSCLDSEKGYCWWKGSKSVPFANTHLWKPDLHHTDSTSPYNIASFVHRNTHKGISDGPDAKTQHYLGRSLISQQQWESFARGNGLIGGSST